MITYLSIAALIIVLINAICVALDKLMLNRVKPKLYVSIQNIWARLYLANAPDLAKICARYAIAMKTKLFGSTLLSIRGLLLSFVLSISLTTLAYGFGQGITEDVFFTVSGWYVVNINEIPGAIWIGYLINYIFDFLTLALTFFIWAKITKGSTAYGLFLLAFDAVMAFVFATSCAVAILYLIDQAFDFQQSVLNASLGLLTLGEYDEEVLWGDALFSSTTLLPTAIFAVVLFTLVVAKLVANAGKAGILYFGEKVLEGGLPTVDDPKQFQPFTLIGVLLSILGALVALLIGIIKANLQQGIT